MKHRGDARTILCVEDEVALLDELVEELEDHGYVTLQSRDAAAAKTILRSHDPDLILCDIMLPDQTGLDLLRELKQDRIMSASTAFIFVTALSDRAKHLEGLQAGAHDYITKPVDLELLHLQIENTIALVRDADTDREIPASLHNVAFSRREKNVLGLLGKGWQTAEIARHLEISEHTVNQYIKTVYKKIGARNRAEAVRAAILLGL